MNLRVVILAAGKGTRMKSNLPKVLHPLGGRPLITYSLELAQAVSPEPPVVVVGHQAQRVREAVGDAALFVEQTEQLGTGHAVMQARDALRNDADALLVYAADMPLLRAETLRGLVARHASHDGPLTMLTVEVDDPRGFGRIVRAADGGVTAIVEEVEATPEQRAIRELNVGVYCFDADWLWSALDRIEPSPKKGEYYLTDTVALAVIDGFRVEAVQTNDADEALGVNTRVHLAEAEAVLRRRINQSWMLAGVTIIDPERTYIMPGVEIGRDVVLWPGVHLLGETVVGEGCEIGPNAVLRDVALAPGVRVAAGAVIRG
ncbi:MAG: bifunctional N-acetylglucosamine-1-phosphate uridyltransferase/glucosamine-1-phosphate acetyltransferase [Chloroflexi bacterium]|nr:bifunctional N-acetylglucosamine-1-phosphate uridyltransferase/glucosamine-1-phosphate acetyltransferase [Chloroflexota bacterium]